MLGVCGCQMLGLLISQVIHCQTHAIGKAIRPLFADWITYFLFALLVLYIM